MAIPVVVFASYLAAAWADASNLRGCVGLDGPSNFDYLVLASMADSPNLAAMAGYRSTAGQRSESGAPPVGIDSEESM
jgi:hypothetical protein